MNSIFLLILLCEILFGKNLLEINHYALFLNNEFNTNLKSDDILVVENEGLMFDIDNQDELYKIELIDDDFVKFDVIEIIKELLIKILSYKEDNG